jgi:hypothetical protein
MTGTSPAMTIERHWEASDASDFNVEHEIYQSVKRAGSSPYVLFEASEL